MPDVGDALTTKFLSDYSRVQKQKKDAEKALSSGEISNWSIRPMQAAQGQNATAKIAALTTANQQAIEAKTLCDSINNAIQLGISILTEQVELATSANSDTNDSKIKKLYDNNFQNALEAFDASMRSIRWNGSEILTQTINNVSYSSPLGIYSPTAGNHDNAFAFGLSTPDVENFHDLTGYANGAVGAVNVNGNTISLPIGAQTFQVDTTGITINSGDIITLTDTLNSNNKIGFKIASDNPTVNDIAAGIDSLLNGMHFSPNITNLNPVSNFFTGGVNYNYTKGHFSGTPSDVSVENIGNQLKITLTLSQSSGEKQFFSAIIPKDNPGNTIIFNSQNNAQNSIAFNFAESLSQPLDTNTLKTALTSLLGVYTTPATFQGMSVNAYPGLSITAANSVTSGRYSLTYTILPNGKGQFFLNSGERSEIKEISLPISNQQTISFANGLSLKITDSSLFEDNQSKSQMLFTVSHNGGNNILHFQTGTETEEQVVIYPPHLTTQALGLTGIHVQTNEDAVFAGKILKDALHHLTSELGRMTYIGKNIEQHQKNAENSMEHFQAIKSQTIGTDTIRELVTVTETEALSDVIHTSLAKELQRRSKLLELLKELK